MKKFLKNQKENQWRIPVAFISLQVPDYQLFIYYIKSQVKHFFINFKLEDGVGKFVC
jgi:hypothetical protein